MIEPAANIAAILARIFSISPTTCQEIAATKDPVQRVNRILSSQPATSTYSTNPCTDHEATVLFWLALDRLEEQESRSRTASSIFSELIQSDEFQLRRIASIAAMPGNETAVCSFSLQSGNFELHLDPANPFRNFDGLLTLTPGMATFAVNRSTDPGLILNRIVQPLLPVMERLLMRHSASIISPLVTRFSFADEGLNDHGVCYCSNSSSDTLIPDSYFLASKGYQKFRAINSKQFPEKLDQAYFRGTDTGCHRFTDKTMCPRVIVAGLSRMFPDLLDAGITSTEPRADQEKTLPFIQRLTF